MRKKQTRFKWLDRVAAFKAPGKIKALLWPLAYHANEAGECYPSVETLADEAGWSAATARRRLHDLDAKGLIQIAPRSVPFHTEGRTLYVNRYRLTLPEKTPKRPSRVLQGHSGETTLQNAETTLQNERDDLAELCKAKPIRSQFRKPIPEAAGKEPAGLPGHFKTDYQKAELPDIGDYSDIHDPANDPVLVAMAVCDEKGKQGWGHWVKVLNQARKAEGRDHADKVFRDCLAELWGEVKAGECDKSGACFNLKLKEVFG